MIAASSNAWRAWTALAWLPCALAVGASEPSITLQLAQAGPAPDWTPSQLKESQFDWIQLRSGEWLKGRFRGMQSDRLDFYSEELDSQEFDWDKIHQLYTVDPVELLLDDRTTFFGRVRVNRQYLVINEDSIVPRLFDRASVVSISPGGTSELSRWTADVAFGLSVRSGNSEQSDANLAMTLKRRSATTRLVATYQGYMTSVAGQTTANNHRASTYFDRWFTSRVFMRVVEVDYYRDPFQNIDGRITAGTGLGYDLIRSSAVDWHVTVGPAIQWVRFVSVQSGQDQEEIGPAGFLTTLFEWKLTRRIDLDIEESALVVERKLGGLSLHSEVRFEIDLTSILELDIAFIWDHVSHPIPDANGVRPKSDDFRLVTSISLDF